jgi:single-strand DNA-binding protein
MASRNLNMVQLIGNLTRDPEMRYTPQGNAVASFVVATNREWVVNGEKKQSVDFHNIVSWNKLAEICGQLLKKGVKVYVLGRLQTRDWTTESGEKKYKTEVVIEDMILLTPKKDGESMDDNEIEMPATAPATDAPTTGTTSEEINLDDINLDDLGVSSDSGK